MIVSRLDKQAALTTLNKPEESQCGPSSDLGNATNDFGTSTEWKFQGYLYFDTTQWTVIAGDNYENAVLGQL